MKITPFFVEKPWGGTYIPQLYDFNAHTLIGEAFVISTLENNESSINSEKLSHCIGTKLPYLVKIIDASENLSLQVHPNDHWAKVLENSVGKTECWLVLESDENAGIYFGFKKDSSFDHLLADINNKSNASDCLNFIKVKKGDFISVPAGTIHAIGSGVRILEFQQASGITYRIWDWEREGRELHLEKAKMVTPTEPMLPNITAFETIELDEVFFEHEDFILKKKTHASIECYSKKVSTKFEVDINNFNCSMS